MNNLSRIDALNRALIGFDTMFDALERRLANSSVDKNYPPHNVRRTDENQYEIQMAVTGFNKDEIAVTLEDDVLVIRGESKTPNENADMVYIHRGLATRDFVKEFPLAEHIEVAGAEIKNGLLTVKLVRNVPEPVKPLVRTIDINEVK